MYCSVAIPMAVMAGRRSIPVGAVQAVALITDCTVGTQFVMRDAAVYPAYPCGHLAPGWTEVTCVTADARSPTPIVTPMARGTL